MTTEHEADQRRRLERAREIALFRYSLVQELLHANGLAGAISDVWLFDLPADEYRTFVPRLHELTVEGVKQAAQRTLSPERMTISIAGDRAQVLSQVKPLGLPEPQLRTPTGALAK